MAAGRADLAVRQRLDAAQGEAVARAAAEAEPVEPHGHLVKAVREPDQDAARLQPGKHAEPARRRLADGLRRPAELHRVRLLRPRAAGRHARQERAELPHLSVPLERHADDRAVAARPRRRLRSGERRGQLERRHRTSPPGACSRAPRRARWRPSPPPRRPAFRRRSPFAPPVRTSLCRRSTARAPCSARPRPSRGERPPCPVARRARGRRTAAARRRTRWGAGAALLARGRGRKRVRKQVRRTERLAQLHAVAAERVGVAGGLARDGLARARFARRVRRPPRSACSGRPRASSRDVTVSGSLQRRAPRAAARLLPGRRRQLRAVATVRQGELVRVHAALRAGGQTIPFAWSFTAAVAGPRRRRRRQPASGAAEGRLPALSLAPDLQPPTVDRHDASAGHLAGRHLPGAVLRAGSVRADDPRRRRLGDLVQAAVPDRHARGRLPRAAVRRPAGADVVAGPAGRPAASARPAR